MKILISGSHGMVGQALLPILKKAGHETAVLVRRATSGSSTQIHEVYWEPSTGMIDTASLRKWGPPDALIHLAGKNIAEGRWTRKHKEEIRDSRVEATRLLCESLLISGLAPKTYIAASATGIYGNRGEEILNEQSPPGNDFLASVTKEWEAAAGPLEKAGSRMVWLRIGMILSRKGGALGKMLPAFKMGIAGKLGSGKQWISWIHMEDLLGVILFVLENENLSGVLNTVAPHPVQNVHFTKAFGKAVRRPTIFPAPAPLLKLAFGQVANDVLLASQRTMPTRLQELGYKHKHPNIDGALQELFSQTRAKS